MEEVEAFRRLILCRFSCDSLSLAKVAWHWIRGRYSSTRLILLLVLTKRNDCLISLLTIARTKLTANPTINQGTFNHGKLINSLVPSETAANRDHLAWGL
jgi:hypothetical protein